ncbi:hypothetical protein [Brevundimonas sp. NIBR11]|uniref:hypothetical protein n=1 Tax=Brevundimonas sp. NIBR11 TaxID=3015999 RepID=UPI0022F0840D|nr:hypothetical protein [Brevundimonas sp. NIBR11]WGM30416.1 hypothetical protein KKHFBJBL_00639 [Brevundimonas sp. NIBR11]
MIRPLMIAAALALPVLAGCNGSVKAPTDTGVCYAVETPEGEPTFNVVARDQAQIEMCAARLEEMRLRFRGLGSTRQEVTGAYQGQFIFVDRRGVSFARTLTGARFFALARTGDGRLAVPGAIEREAGTKLGTVIEERPAPTFPGQ